MTGLRNSNDQRIQRILLRSLTSGKRGGESRESKAQLRLQKLEEMITSLIRTTKEESESRSDNTSPQVATANQCSNNLPPPSSSFSPEEQSSMNSTEQSYVSATHWTAILENVGVPHSRKRS